jgi:D-alanyl-D-alanine carboxypeptidase
VSGTTASGTTASGTTASGTSQRTALSKALSQLVSDGVPGAIGIERRAGREWRAAAGVANLKTGQAIRPGDRFRIGSMTKAFVSVVILKLASEHRLKLSNTVSHWLPGLVPHGNRITIRELMNHTSGLYDYINLHFYLNILRHPLQTWRPVTLVKRAVAHPLLFPPGTQWSYSNTDYVLLGLIISAVDRIGQAQRAVDPAEQVYRRIVRPLRLRHTSFPITSPAMRPPYSHGYVIHPPAAWHLPSVLDTTRENPSWAWTAGAMVSTLDDVANFHRALFAGHLLPAKQRRELKTTVQAAPGLRYGLGVFRVQTPCGPAWGHDGGTPNAVSISLTSPDGARQAAIMVNEDANTWTNAIANDFTSAYLTAFCGKQVSATAAHRLATAMLPSLQGQG